MTSEECLDKLKGTKDGAIEFLKCLKEHDILIYWNKEWKLIARSKSGRGSWNSFMKYVMDILKISNKKDWERLNREYKL